MLTGTLRRARRSERREWRKSRQGTRNERGLVIQIPLTNSPGSLRHSRSFFTSSKVNSRLIASITSTLPFGATFTFLPCRSSKSMSLSSTCPTAAVPPICVMIFKPTESRAKGAFFSLTARPVTKGCPKTEYPSGVTAANSVGVRLPAALVRAMRSRNSRKVGRGPAATRICPSSAQSHLAGHKSASLAVLDLEKFVDDFAFLVVINPGFRSLIKLRQGPELCGVQQWESRREGRRFRLRAADRIPAWFQRDSRKVADRFRIRLPEDLVVVRRQPLI